MVDIGLYSIWTGIYQTTKATNCLVGVEHGISAILKVGSPISDVKYPPLSLLIASVRE